MNGALTIGVFWGIPVRIHWSFGFIILIVSYTAMSAGLSLKDGLGYFLIVMLLFCCVVMHEYGHALTAKYYGIKTKDIIISPIGGVARLESLPKKSLQELIIALAGPAVNIVLAIVLGIITVFFGYFDLSSLAEQSFIFNSWAELVKYLILMNLALFVFNLIPAFPMDGGRVLRALLSMWLGRLKGTRIATGVGQFLAIVFSAIGIYFGHIILAFIGVFIFIAAASEARQVKIAEFLQNAFVKDIMRNQFTPIYVSENFTRPISLMMRNVEKNFLVFNDDHQVIGSLPELFIRDVIKKQTDNMTVGEFFSEQIGFIDKDMPLIELFNLMNTMGLSIAAVEENGNIIGVVDRSALSNAIEIKMGNGFFA